MTAVTLIRIKPERNIWRFYKIDLQLDLFGEYSVIRERGRIGRPGTVSSMPYASAIEAEAAGIGSGSSKPNVATELLTNLAGKRALRHFAAVA